MKLDLGDYEQRPTDQIAGFGERLKQLIPSLYEHRCSKNKPGGFFERVEQGTWLGHVAEHIALEIQTLAGMACGYGRTRSTNESGVYYVVFAYQVEKAGIYAAKAAVDIVLALADNIYYDISKDIEELKKINRYEGLGPSSQAIIDACIKRDIPWRRLDKGSLLLLGHGKNQKIIRATVAGTTSNLAVELAADKEETKKMLEHELVPVPKGRIISDTEDLDEIIQELGFPLVIKPVDGNHGRGVSTNIRTREEALKALEMAKQISEDVIAEQYITGADYRFLVINYKLVAVSKRTPAMVMGDGSSTIKELIEKTNADPKRGEGHENILSAIKIDAVH
jgi:cyanophycin synthetase